MRYASVVAVFLPVLLAGCGDSTGPIEDSPPASLSVAEGDGQTESVGRTVDDPLVVRILDQQERGVEGAVVGWRVIDGDGELAAPTTETDQDGYSSNRWTLGKRMGSQAVEAGWIDSATGEAALTDTFSATALLGTIDRINVGAECSTEVLGGDALPGDTVSYSATAVDEYGNIRSSGFSWSMTDPSVARIYGEGELVAEDSGRAEVVASRDGVAGHDPIVVVRPDSATWSHELCDFDYYQSNGLPEPTARGGHRAIRITGGIGTPCLTTKGRFSFHGTLTGADALLRIAWDRGGLCQTAYDFFTYETRLLGIPPGEYRVQLEYDGLSGREDPPLDTIVQVR